MKILHCTDLHFSQPAINWITNNCDQYDVVCLTGDFLDQREVALKSVTEQVNYYQQWFDSFKQPLLVCSGNHDYVDGSLSWLAKRNDLLGDGTIETINGITFGCIGYDHNAFEVFSNCDVLLYHLPPSGCSCAKENGHNFGDLAIQQALKQSLVEVKYLLCGHVHRPMKNAIRLKSVIVSNPGGIHTDKMASHAVIEINI